MLLVHDCETTCKVNVISCRCHWVDCVLICFGMMVKYQISWS